MFQVNFLLCGVKIRLNKILHLRILSYSCESINYGENETLIVR